MALAGWLTTGFSSLVSMLLPAGPAAAKIPLAGEPARCGSAWGWRQEVKSEWWRRRRC